MRDYCRWCGRYTEVEDLECRDCRDRVLPWFERFHFDPDAPIGEQWRPVIDVRSELL